MKKRRVKTYRYDGPGNSLTNWSNITRPPRVLKNIIIIKICQYLPLKLKNKLYKSIGIKIGKNVSIAYGVNFDFLFPELIEIRDNSIIGFGTTILAHEFLIKEWRTGKVIIGKNVMVGALTLIMPGSEIGDNSTVAAYSLVNKNIPKNSKVGGIPIKKLRS